MGRRVFFALETAGRISGHRFETVIHPEPPRSLAPGPEAPEEEIQRFNRILPPELIPKIKAAVDYAEKLLERGVRCGLEENLA